MLMNAPTEIITVIPMRHAQIQRKVLHVHAIPATVVTELIVKVKRFDQFIIDRYYLQFPTFKINFVLHVSRYR